MKGKTYKAGDEIFEPFLRSKEVTTKIKALLTIHEQRKFGYYYQDWGCLCCKTKERPHHALGMCWPCHARFASRIKGSLARRTHEPSKLVDTEELVREAPPPPSRTLQVLPGHVSRHRVRGELR